MKTKSLISYRLSITGFFLKSLMVQLICLIISMAGFSQEVKKVKFHPELKQQQVTEFQHPVEVTFADHGQLQVMQVQPEHFQLPLQTNIAMVKANEIRNFESAGTVSDNRGVRKIRGMVLGELLITRIQGQSEPSTLEMVVDTTQQMVYDQKEEIFRGLLKIILLDDHPGDLFTKNLAEPVLLEISPGSEANAEPQNFRIDHTNLPSFPVMISDRSSQNPVPLNIRTIFDPQGHQIFLKKEQVLRIETPSKKMQGWGVESIPVMISILGNANPGPVKITVVTTKGSVEPNTIEVSEGNPGEVHLKSGGKGTAMLTISANGFSDVSRDYYFVIPWMFILLSILGGLFGSLTDFLMNKGNRKIRNVLLLGVITGFFMAILFYVLGIELFSIKLSHTINEFAVLGLGFLGGLFWNKIYEGLKNIIAPHA